MTCVVGLVDNGRVYIGGDSLALGGFSKELRADKKVFVRGEFAIGFAGSYRMGQLLQYKLVIPEHKPEMDNFEYMVSEFVEATRECFQKGGFSNPNSNEINIGSFLVGYRGELFRITDDFQVSKPYIKYDAIGCGGDIAKGSLYSTEGDKPKNRIIMALSAAAQLNAGVAGPFHVVSV